MGHVVLAGDSTLDNGRYVPPGLDVVQRLRRLLPLNWQASLRAVDGAVTRSVPAQLASLPPDTSHLVVSVGGNDALGQAHVLEEEARSVAQALERLAGVRERFAADYLAMLDQLLAHDLPTALCTIYDGRLPAPWGRPATTALMLFNDAITRAAFAHGLPLIDLRLICAEDADYANPIEPSVQGGAKIAAAIAELVGGHGRGTRHSIVLAQ